MKSSSKAGKAYTVKKEKSENRNNELDPNNNINLPDKPIVKRRGKKVHDDGFEHRTSDETAELQ